MWKRQRAAAVDDALGTITPVSGDTADSVAEHLRDHGLDATGADVLFWNPDAQLCGADTRFGARTARRLVARQRLRICVSFCAARWVHADGAAGGRSERAGDIAARVAEALTRTEVSAGSIARLNSRPYRPITTGSPVLLWVPHLRAGDLDGDDEVYTVPDGAHTLRSVSAELADPWGLYAPVGRLAAEDGGALDPDAVLPPGTRLRILGGFAPPPGLQSMPTEVGGRVAEFLPRGEICRFSSLAVGFGASARVALLARFAQRYPRYTFPPTADGSPVPPTAVSTERLHAVMNALRRAPAGRREAARSAVATSGSFSVWVAGYQDSTRTLYGCGLNQHGESLGGAVATNRFRWRPRPHPPGMHPRHMSWARAVGGRRVVAVAVGTAHALALLETGRVWSWGLHSDGQCGQGVGAPWHCAPAAVSLDALAGGGQPRFVGVTAACHASFALDDAGSVYHWGQNAQDVAGYEHADIIVWSPRGPVRVRPPGARFVSVAAGSRHVVAADSEGAVYTWGGNDNGQLGREPGEPGAEVVATPPPVARVVKVAAGAFHSAVLDEHGLVSTFGSNARSQLGCLGAGPGLFRPPADGACVDVAAGGGHTLALSDRGAVYVCGAPLGEPHNADRASEWRRQLAAREAIKSVHAGGGISFVVTEEAGRLYSAGVDGARSGVRGHTGATQPSRYRPVEMGPPARWAASRGNTTYFVDEGGEFVCAAGDNAQGQYGDGTTAMRWGAHVAFAPSELLAAPQRRVRQLAAGAFHCLARLDDGSVLAWGGAAQFQCGLADPPARLPVPRLVACEGAALRCTHVAATNFASFALALDGSLLSWGTGTHGELGQGPHTTTAAVPRGGEHRVVVGGADSLVVELVGGHEHVLARRADDRVFGWGSNADGQLAIDPRHTTSLLYPCPLQLPGGFGPPVALAAGQAHSLVLGGDGRACSCGAAHGRLGRSTGRAPPWQMDFVERVVRAPPWEMDFEGSEDHRVVLDNLCAVAAGDMHSMFLRDADGKRRVWWAGSLVNDRPASGLRLGAYDAARECEDPRITRTSMSIQAIFAGGSQCFVRLGWANGQRTEGLMYAQGPNRFGATGTYVWAGATEIHSAFTLVSIDADNTV